MIAQTHRNPNFRDYVLSVRFSGGEKKLMEDFYHRTGIERSTLIRLAVRKFIDQHQKQE